MECPGSGEFVLVPLMMDVLLLRRSPVFEEVLVPLMMDVLLLRTSPVSEAVLVPLMVELLLVASWLLVFEEVLVALSWLMLLPWLSSWMYPVFAEMLVL